MHPKLAFFSFYPLPYSAALPMRQSAPASRRKRFPPHMKHSDLRLDPAT